MRLLTPQAAAKAAQAPRVPFAWPAGWRPLLMVMTMMLSNSAGAGPEVTYEAFRDAMAYERDAEFQALLSACRQQGRWPEREDGFTLLHLAPHVGGRHAAQYTRALLAEGLSARALTRDPHSPVTPLRMAVRFSCVPCAEALLAAGADVQERNPAGETLLHDSGSATVPVLLAAGLSPALRDHQGNLPLHRVWHPALLAAGVNAVNAAGLTPLHTAALEDSLGRVDALLAAGADPALRTTRPGRWRRSGMSPAFGAGQEVPQGATAYDLARGGYKASRWSTQSHEAVMKRLEAVTPRRGWLGF